MNVSVSAKSIGFSRQLELVPLFSILLLLIVIASTVALWSDMLRISMDVTTGDVDLEWYGIPVATDTEHFLPEPKDVGECSAYFSEVEDEDADSLAGDNDLDLVIAVENAYPSYVCKVNGMAVKNAGSIPVILDVYIMPPNGGICYWKPGGDADLQYIPHWDCDLDGDGDYDLNIWGSLTSLPGLQLHPGDVKFFSVELHVKRGAPERATFIMQIKIIGMQWNEAGYPPEVPPEVNVLKEFRHSGIDLGRCPVYLDVVLSQISVNVPTTGKQAGRVTAVSPGAFYGVVYITGEGIQTVSITDYFDTHFRLISPIVRVVLLDSNNCPVPEGIASWSYMVYNNPTSLNLDNPLSGVIRVSITLSNPMKDGETLLVLFKYDDTNLKNQKWFDIYTKDATFTNRVQVTTNIGSAEAIADLPIVRS